MTLTFLMTLATFLLELCSSSPVYNMQPAFITTHIGSAGTGRNIRHLPCVSRKTNQSGVCMFAINCLKANGTHLGTCIDKFYFGSCCHIEPPHDIIDNTIDSDIIPSREPPHRITTLKPVLTTLVPELSNKINKISSTSIINDVTTTLSSTLSTTLSTSLSTTLSPPSTEKLTTKTAETTTPSSTTTTTQAQKLSTFQLVESSVTTSTNAPTTRKPIVPSKKPYKPTTVRPKTTTRGTARPISTKAPSNKPSKATVKPTRGTAKPVRTTKPTKSSTRRPTTTKASTTSVPSTTPSITTTTTIKSTTKPSSTTVKETTVKVESSTIKLESSTTKIEPSTIKVEPSTIKYVQTTPEPLVTSQKVETTTSTTNAPVRTTVPLTVPTTASQTTFVTTSSPPVVHEEIRKNVTSPSTTTTEKAQTTSTIATSTITSTKLNATNVLESVNGNTATNEIIENEKETFSTEKSTMNPVLITWTVNDYKRNETTTESYVEINATTEEDWVPITSPDHWVLLPSVPPTYNASQKNETYESTTENAPTVPTTLFTDYPFTPVPSTTLAPEGTSKPLISYIPLEEPSSTTDARENITFTTTEESSTNAESTTVEDVESTTILGSTTVSTDPEIPSVNMSDFTNVCGRRMYPEARIVGGEKASFGKWPWQISLRQWRTSTYLHKCGAALLNENWAITAAHCVDNVPPSDLLLRLGEHDLSTEGEPYLHQERRVQIVASHPQFDPRTFEYDLALLRFYEPVTFQPNILPVCVPQNDENFVGRTAHVTGWGRLYEDGPLPSVLQEVSVPVINNTVCESMYRSAGYIEHIPHIFICAGWRRGGFDSCEGDSGGPMVIQREDRRFLLAGVISWGIGCAEPNQPGVYTRISEFRDWINQILQF